MIYDNNYDGYQCIDSYLHFFSRPTYILVCLFSAIRFKLTNTWRDGEKSEKSCWSFYGGRWFQSGNLNIQPKFFKYLSLCCLNSNIMSNVLLSIFLCHGEINVYKGCFVSHAAEKGAETCSYNKFPEFLFFLQIHFYFILFYILISLFPSFVLGKMVPSGIHLETKINSEWRCMVDVYKFHSRIS